MLRHTGQRLSFSGWSPGLEIKSGFSDSATGCISFSTSNKKDYSSLREISWGRRVNKKQCKGYMVLLLHLQSNWSRGRLDGANLGEDLWQVLWPVGDKGEKCRDVGKHTGQNEGVLCFKVQDKLQQLYALIYWNFLWGEIRGGRRKRAMVRIPAHSKHSNVSTKGLTGKSVCWLIPVGEVFHFQTRRDN